MKVTKKNFTTELFRGWFAANKAALRQYVIARDTGISQSKISFVLNGFRDDFTEDERDRIIKYMNKTKRIDIKIPT